MAMEMHRYQQVAAHIEDQIERGLLLPGTRLPSVRRLSTQMGVSISTVLQGYGVLLDRRLVEVRPQSGYYVSARPCPTPAPAMSRPRGGPALVEVSLAAMEVARANERPGVIQLGTAAGRRDFPAVRRLYRQLAAATRDIRPQESGYDMPPGNADLRLQIARRAADAGVRVSPDEVVITNGSQEAMVLCLRAVAEPGDTVVIESPGFYGTLQAIQALGLKALELPTDPQDGPSLDALRLALEQWSVKACVLTPSYSNPLGYCMRDEHRRRLLALLDDARVPLVEDDSYADLGYGPRRPRAVKSWDRTGNVLLCSSLSKTLDPGIRVGWALPGRYLDKVSHLKLVMSMSNATLPVRAAARHLEGSGHDRHLQTVRRVYRQQRDMFTSMAAQLLPQGTRITRPEGGFLAWVELPAGTDAMVLHRLAMAAGISVAPGPLFSPTGKYRRFVRINYARLDGEQMGGALSALAGLVAVARRER